ncbi:hypothetical protein DIPPA_01940 [Diplonema papillatum]|nr:hypothetical protein DIPPA_01940 [Diplonema papillatum]
MSKLLQTVTIACLLASGTCSCELFAARRADLLLHHQRATPATVPFEPLAKDLHSERHTPSIEILGTTVIVTVGVAGKVHPTVAGRDRNSLHYIQNIFVVDQDDRVLAMTELSPAGEEEPSLSFLVPEGTSSVKAYASCNTHGLFESAEVFVDETTDSPIRCALAACLEASDDAKCDRFELLAAECLRLQTLEHGTAEPFELDAMNKAHVPYITINKEKGEATVTVGSGTVAERGPVHPTVSNPPEKVHYIRALYVADGSGSVVAASLLSPAGTERPSLSFRVPKGAGELTAFSFCNRHGLFKSAPVAAPATVYSPSCEFTQCGRPPAAASDCGGDTCEL